MLRGDAAEDSKMFDLASMTRERPLLRLFLQDVTDKNVGRQSILLGAGSARDLDEASRQMTADGASGCPATKATAASCIPFQSGVSLLIACTVNGRLTYTALGTTVSQIIDDKQPALRSLILTRSLTSGGYAEVTFPKTLEAAQQITLLNGDKVSWKH